jgi:hypothetical protein
MTNENKEGLLNNDSFKAFLNRITNESCQRVIKGDAMKDIFNDCFILGLQFGLASIINAAKSNQPMEGIKQMVIDLRAAQDVLKEMEDRK